MPVPMSVMEAAAQGDKKAMRLVEKEYGVGNGQDFAIDQLSEEFPPGRVVKSRDYEDLKRRYPEGTDPEGPGLPIEGIYWHYDSLQEAIDGAPEYGQYSDEYRKAGLKQITDFEKELFGEQIDKLKPADQKDLILELSKIDEIAADWANKRLNNPVSNRELAMYKYDPINNTPTNPTIQPVLNYYKERFSPARRPQQSSSSMHRY